MHRNLAQSLIEHGMVKTTTPKARDIRPYFERLISLAIKVRQRRAADDHAGALRARRAIHKMLGDRGMIPAEHLPTYESMSDAAREKTRRMATGRRHRTGDPKGRLTFTAESIMHRLIETVAPRFEDRPGGYTRLIRLADRRIGDNSPLAVVQVVGEEEAPTSLTKPGKSARQRRADSRYAMAISRAKQRSGKGRDRKTDGPAATEEPQAEPSASAEEAETKPAEAESEESSESKDA
jgi:large subunit ribosomal protein L17